MSLEKLKIIAKIPFVFLGMILGIGLVWGTFEMLQNLGTKAKGGQDHMKIAVLSDIHGNHIALETCLKYLKKQKVDAYLFLGDYVGELTGNGKTIDLLRKLSKRKKCYIVRGNKEEYQFEGLGEDHPEWDAYPSLVGMIRYGREQLSDAQMEFIQSLPQYLITDFEGMEEILLCHGSPNHCKQPAYGKDGVNHEGMQGFPQKYILCGHTHRMANYEENGVHYWNPGSVGLPLDGRTQTQFMILHSRGSEWEPEWVTLDYDYEAVIEEMQKQRFYEIAPYWTKITEHLLRGGRTNHGTVLKLAMELCYQETGECEWPCIPEIYMKTAYERLIGAVH